ncbi:MAG: xanthine dehydrogenase family protein subunit M [Burkholderiales bacterium]|nr:xanthine dehydrogenase family protein subunit M [Burkholderiales bacterium]
MKPAAFRYAAPRSVDEALHLLQLHGDDAKLLAGGQSLVPVLNLRLAAPGWLIDLNRIAELAGIRELPDGSIEVGALTRHATMGSDPRVRVALPVIHAAVPHIAHLQIRNRGTIGGSLAHADPAAEWPALCLACDATIVVNGPRGERRIPAEAFSLGVYSTALAADEILTAVRFPAWPPGRRWAFQEMARRQGDFAITGVVALADCAPDGHCETARIVIFGAADRPVLAHQAAEALVGRRVDAAAIAAAAALARDGIEPMSDHHAAASYRRRLVAALTRRALNEVFAIEDQA